MAMTGSKWPQEVLRQGSDVNMSRLESGMSVRQVRASMTMKEKLSEIRRAKCMNRREIVHTRLEAIVRANIPYSLIAIFGRRYQPLTTGQRSSWTPSVMLYVKLPEHNNFAPPTYKLGDKYIALLEMQDFSNLPCSRG
jgi:hypothetical protein